MNSSKCFFQGFSLLFQKCSTSERVFHEAMIFVKHIWLALPVFCVYCKLKTPNLEHQYLQLSASHDNKFGNILEDTMRLIILFCISMGTSISRDYVVNSLFSAVIIYMNKSYQNAVFKSVIWQTKNFVFII